jgi:hypothetical protein
VPGGSAKAYSYTFGDPVNSSDPTGAYVEGAYLQGFNDTENQHAIEREVARVAAARLAAELAALEAAGAAGLAGPQYEEEWEEWEEGGYEYAKYSSVEPSPTEAEAVFFGGEAEARGGKGGRVEAGSGVVSLCASEGKTKEAPCGLYSLSLGFGKAFNWVRRHAKSLVGAGISFVTGAALGVGTVFATASCFAASEGLEVLECGKIALAGGTASAGAFAAGVAALYSGNVFGRP